MGDLIGESDDIESDLNNNMESDTSVNRDSSKENSKKRTGNSYRCK